MLLVALISVGGFTVLAQRRLRSLGMLASIGATEKQVRVVVRTNGAVVGVVGTLLGALVGLIVWLIYRPNSRDERPPRHRNVLAAVGGNRTGDGTRCHRDVPVGAPPGSDHREGADRHRAFWPAPSPEAGSPLGASRSRCFLVAAFVLLGYTTTKNSASPQVPFLVGGVVALIPGVILLAPFFLSLAGRIGGRAPIGTRLALRDLARYRARSGPALSAISIGVLITVIIAVAAAARYGQVLDYAGPNLASNQAVVYAPPAGGSQLCSPDGLQHGSDAALDGFAGQARP